MLASLVDATLDDPDFVYEPKYDGIRAVAEISARGGAVKLWSRLGNDKAAQFPEVVTALQKWARRRTAPLVLDGEVVALDAKGQPSGFQDLQRRSESCAFIVFDILRDGATDLRRRPLVERRQALERLLGKTTSSTIRIREMRRRHGTPRTRAREGGRPDREARRLGLSRRQAHARLAQARPRAGIRRRRLTEPKHTRIIWARCRSAFTTTTSRDL